MSRRTHACLSCTGRTRHENQVCSACRRYGVTNRGGELKMPVTLRILPTIKDVTAPTRAELEAGTDLTAALRAVKLTWRGTDSGDPTIPGRYA